MKEKKFYRRFRKKSIQNCCDAAMYWIYEGYEILSISITKKSSDWECVLAIRDVPKEAPF